MTNAGYIVASYEWVPCEEPVDEAICNCDKLEEPNWDDDPLPTPDRGNPVLLQGPPAELTKLIGRYPAGFL